MTFNEYQEFAKTTAKYPDRGKNLIYPTLGLVGEAGEVAEKVKKLIRDHGGEITEEIRQELVKELGDVLWYLATFATELNVSFEKMAEINVAKLKSRQARGVIHGSGDNR